jgi:hypothetical protein
MKARLSPVHWILIIALASQGALPGVVVCFEETGQVEFETIKEKCCYGDTKPSGQTAVLVLTTSTGSEPAGSCGPCTDTLISPIPVTKPARNGGANSNALPSTALAFDPAAIETETYSASDFVAADTALIPIKTTTLLI